METAPHKELEVTPVLRVAVIGLDRHLKDAHNLRKKRERQPFLDRYSGLVCAKPQDVALPKPNGPPFDALKGPMTGLSCVDCGHLLTQKKGMQEHCNKTDEWYVSKRDPTHWNHVLIQTFFGGSNTRFFTVAVEVPHDGIEPTPAAQDRAYDELRKRFLSGMEEGKKFDNTGWWTHTRWQLHFGDRHLGNIAHASRLDAKRIVISMIKSAVDGLSLLHD